MNDEKGQKTELDTDNAPRHLQAGPSSIECMTAGKYVGPYRLVQQLGEGGMGTVWLAEQLEPVKRSVALKVIKPGIGSLEVLARFEAERQTLAVMNHPNISRIIDSGATPDGQPYFAMELVLGDSLTRYCDVNRLDIKDRLNLFIAVCAGVQHAHQKGIIHRDLKPSNILVTVVDGQPIPKVIDFGLAKALEDLHGFTDQTKFTGIGQVLGTLKYMSPEQAGFNSLDIDTRSDIYALGVMLYELLTGKVPLEDDSLRDKSGLAALAVLRDHEPLKPSSRLSHSSAEELSAVMECRRTHLSMLNRQLSGDLDWIVMKAIDKDLIRRYETAASFADDIQRFLRSEPVTARPPSLNYRARKFIQKNRISVAASALVLTTLLAGMLGTTWGMLRAERSRKDAAAARQIAELRQQQAEASLERAITAEANLELRIQELEAITDFQKLQLEEVQISDFSSKIRNALVEHYGEQEVPPAGIEDGTALDVMLERINFMDVSLQLLQETFFENSLSTLQENYDAQPLFQATMLHAIGESALKVGLLDFAEKPLQEALDIRRKLLGSEHVDTMQSIDIIANLFVELGQLELGEKLHREALELRSARYGEDDERTLSSLNNVGVALFGQGKLTEAEEVLDECMSRCRNALGNDHEVTLQSINDNSVICLHLRKFAEAESLITEALAVRRKVLGNEHRDTLSSITNMGFTLNRQGKKQEAEVYYLEAVEVSRRSLGSEHPSTLIAINNLATLYLQMGKRAEAEPLLRETLTARRRLLGVDHPSTLLSANNMAGLLVSKNEWEEAEELYRTALTGFRRLFPDDSPDVRRQLRSLGKLLFDRQRYLEAIEYLMPAAKFGERPSIKLVLQCLKEINRDEDVVPTANEILRIQREKNQQDLSNLWPIICTVSMSLNNSGYFEDAERIANLALEEATSAEAEPWQLQRLRFIVEVSRFGHEERPTNDSLLLEYKAFLSREQANIPPDLRTEVLNECDTALKQLVP